MQEEPAATESPKEVRDKSRFQFSLKSLLLLSLWIAITCSAYLTFGKAVLPILVGFWVSWIACCISRFLRRNNPFDDIFMPNFFATATTLGLIRLWADGRPQDDWLFDKRIILWIFLSFIFSIFVCLLLTWIYVPRQKNRIKK
jgi:hypothetical protein